MENAACSSIIRWRLRETRTKSLRCEQRSHLRPVPMSSSDVRPLRSTKWQRIRSTKNEWRLLTNVKFMFCSYSHQIMSKKIGMVARRRSETVTKRKTTWTVIKVYKLKFVNRPFCFPNTDHVTIPRRFEPLPCLRDCRCEHKNVQLWKRCLYGYRHMIFIGNTKSTTVKSLLRDLENNAVYGITFWGNQLWAIDLWLSQGKRGVKVPKGYRVCRSVYNAFGHVNRELKQPRRRRQQKPHKFAYLKMKNSIFARFARAFFIFWHFEDVLLLSSPRTGSSVKGISF